MADFNIRVIIDPSQATRGGRQVERQLNRIGTSADRTRQLITRAFAGIGAAVAVRQIVGLTDRFVGLSNRLRTVTDDQSVLNETLDRLSGIASKTRTSLDSVVTLFQRGSIAAKELGASNEELLLFVERVGQGLAVQGGSAASASGALIQLSQSLGSGIVRAEEFNSILEGAFPIAQAAAQGIERAGGSVAKLRQLIIEGEVSSRQFFEGFLEGSENLATLFERTTPTIGQAFQVLGDQLTLFVGRLDQSAGISAAFAGFLLSVAKNLDIVADALKPVIAGLATVIALALPALLAKLIALVGALGVAFVTALGPVGALAVIVVSGFTAAATVVERLTGSLFEAEGVAVTFSDVLTATFNVLGRIASAVNDRVVGAFRGLNVEIKDIGDLFGRAFRIVVRFFDILVGLAAGLGRAFGVALRGIPFAFQDIFTRAANAALRIVADLINGAARLLNRLPGVNIGEVAFQEFENRARFSAEQVAQGIARAFTDERNFSLVSNLVGTIEEESVAVARARIEREKLTAAKTADNAVTAAAITLSKEQTSSFESLRDRLDPVSALTRQLKEETELLTLAQQAGLITKAEEADLLGRLKTEFKEASRTLQEELNPALRRQRELLEELRAPTQDYADRIGDLRTLLAKGSIDQETFNRESRNARIALLDAGTDAGAGFERGFLRAQEQIEDFATTSERLITDAFGEARNAVEEFFKTGEFSAKSFFQTIADGLIQLGTQQLFASLFGGGGPLGGITGGIGGGFNLGGLLGNLGGLLPFQQGGAFTVGGNTSVASIPGADNRLVAFRAQDGERVTITPKGGEERGFTVVNNFPIVAGDAPIDVTTRTQQANLAAAAVRKASRRR